MPHQPGDRAPHPPYDPPATDLGDARDEPRGCLFALSQPPLMLFLAFIGTLLLVAAVHDLYLL
ncbi:hypothetical protein QNO07_08370 [Streptomyces sp. 549]|uniref:hypothetical protein n=1 Tax=Streptomyces sp. 549 TaxID=3049076 RepID=UPI0024C3FFFC|nr:hypothetical protein [Streptomyces sp. 549]MDK1473435.1 hypothetical protein [Streptomyces sp. 549]